MWLASFLRQSRARLTMVAVGAALILPCRASGAQQTSAPKLTRAQTIAYLERKFNETRGHAFFDSDERWYVRSYVVSGAATGDVTFTMHASNWDTEAKKHDHDVTYWEQRLTASFNPKYIVSVVEESGVSSPVGALRIALSGNLGRTGNVMWNWQCNMVTQRCSEQVLEQVRRRQRTLGGRIPVQIANTSRSTRVIRVFFLKADPQNAQRMRRALLHLRDLARAEEEPFGQ